MAYQTDNLIIYGSPFKASFTATLVRDVVSNLPGNTTYYDCFSALPLPCDDCGLCKKQDGCRHHDLDDFFAQFETASHVVFACPVYNGSFPAPMKTVIDRFQQFYNARFTRNIKKPVSGKRLVTVVLTMGGAQDVTEAILEQLRPLFSITGCRLAKVVTLTGTDRLRATDTLFPSVKTFPVGE